MANKQKCEKIASGIHNLIKKDKNYTYGDVLGGLELARMWFYTHYASETLCEDNTCDVDIIEASESNEHPIEYKPSKDDLGSLDTEED